MNVIKKLENSISIQSVRNGLVMVLPILFIGAFSLVFMTMPIMPNVIVTLLSSVFNATFGVFAIYTVFAISTSYINLCGNDINYPIAAIIITFTCFCILIGVGTENFSPDLFGTRGTFTALFSSLTVPRLYIALSKKIKTPKNFFSAGMDYAFNNSMSVFFPGLVTILIFALFNLILTKIFLLNSFQEIITMIMTAVFKNLGNNFFSGLLFIFSTSVLWFFGIHGSNVLENVTSVLFTPAIAENAASHLAGLEPSIICSKTFFDVFVLMGGCGTTLCLLLSLLIFSKRQCNKNLSSIALFPMIFNINEIMVFGLPIVFNLYMLVPFILTPLVIYIISYLAMYLHIVPVPFAEVTWTTPIIIGGYIATGSIRGSLLQLFNLIVGIFIYMPFIKPFDLKMDSRSNILLAELVEKCKECEESTVPITFTEISSDVGAMAKSIALDLKRAIKDKSFDIFYQPQYDNNGKCFGVESLLRWKHPLHGYIYPPLMIKLAEETGRLEELEKLIIKRVFADAPIISKSIEGNAKISMNLTVASLDKPSFMDFLREQIEEFKKLNLEDTDICIEITEQMALLSADNVMQKLAEIRKMGYKLAIDDFSMGHTSLKYLQSNQFDIVKLDGSIVKAMMTNQSSKDIVASIIYLSQSMGFQVLAEYVENNEQKQTLESLGCNQYQGYYFSKAVPLSYFKAMMHAQNTKNI